MEDSESAKKTGKYRDWTSPSFRARPLGERRTNLRLWETVTGRDPLFPNCYLQ
jgi:hypothetical protein